MIKEIKDRWTKALRSGDYEQGTEFLNESGRYCCLGVLCDLYIRDKKKDWLDLGIDDEILPIEVARWSGLSSQNPNATSKDGTIDTLSNFNDGQSLNMKGNEMGILNFNEIADLIEAQF
jgi:hypothetical protein